MLFSLQWDKGTEIVGYLVPDTFTGQSTLVVTRHGEELLRMQTTEPRDALVEAGRHETGLCGFTVDEQVLPGLSGMPYVEISEAESGVLVYRRCPADDVLHTKLFRLETQLLPLARLDRAIAPFFQFHFPSIERHGLETTHQLFLMQHTDSVYVSGRLSYKSMEFYIDQGYKSVALLQDPFDELAERILVLRLIGEGFGSILGMRDNVIFEPALAFAAEISLDSVKGIRRAFRVMSPAAATVLSDPLARQLTTRLPNEAAGPSAVSAGLATLANFELVGLRDQADVFMGDLAGILTLDRDDLPTIEPIPAVKQLGERLRACPPVELLLEYDIAIHQQVRTAFKKSGI